MVLGLFVGLLVLLALLTAYTRNFQRTVVDLDRSLGGGGRLLPRIQVARTIVVTAGWPVSLAVALLFIAWWKAVAVVVGSFLLLVPVMGSLTPRPSSRHFVVRLRADLRRRLARGEDDPAELRRLVEGIDRQLSGMPGEAPG